MTMPEWFGEIRFASFDGRPLEDDELDLPDHGYLVLSHAPRRFTTEEYYGWYYAHARENLTSEGFDTVWRYALTPVTVDPEALGRATHAAFYEVHGELPALRSALAESAAGAPRRHPRLDARGRVRVVGLPGVLCARYCALKPPSSTSVEPVAKRRAVAREVEDGVGDLLGPGDPLLQRMSLAHERVGERIGSAAPPRSRRPSACRPFRARRR